MARARRYPVRVGHTVFDRDGHRIGTVSEVFGAIFKLDGDRRSDIWLGLDLVDNVADGQSVTLKISRDEVDRYRAAVELAS